MLFKRRKKTNQQEENTQKIIKQESAEFQVVDACEQMIDAAREFEAAREEYAQVTNYLTDIERMENMEDPDKKLVCDAAASIAQLERKRTEFLKTENKISDSQYVQMQELEAEIPRAIKRLEKNERNLDAINRDLRFLESEKMELDIEKDEAVAAQKKFRIYAVFVIAFFVTVVVLCMTLRFQLDVDTTVFTFVGAIIAAFAGTFVFYSYQEQQRQIRSCNVNKNRAIVLENRVKIKYVNVKNTIDYTYEKYHIKNSKELIYIYEQYLLAVKEKERFRQTNEDLEYNSKKLLRVLQTNDFYDARVWLNYTNAIVDHREMVELKHELIGRRQKLRGRMKYNIEAVTGLRREILSHREQVGDKINEINRILNKIAELNMELEYED